FSGESARGSAGFIGAGWRKFRGWRNGGGSSDRVVSRIRWRTGVLYRVGAYERELPGGGVFAASARGFALGGGSFRRARGEMSELRSAAGEFFGTAAGGLDGFGEDRAEIFVGHDF